MGRLRARQDYESLRNARITRIKARMESLGLNHSAGELSSVKSIKGIKRTISTSASPLRRSNRLTTGKSCDNDSSSPQDPLLDVGGQGEAKTDAHVSEIKECEKLEHAGISENKARMAPRGLGHKIGIHQIINYSTKTSKRVGELKPDLGTPPRRSDRLKGKSYDFDSSSPKEPSEEIGDHTELVQESSIVCCRSEGEASTDDPALRICEYESLRNARISENKARMAFLGLDRSIRELQDIVSSTKSGAKTSKRNRKSKLDLATPVRRSDRLSGKSYDFDSSSPQASPVERDERSATVKRRLFSNSDRCGSKERGSIYDPILGICCHFCRQKKLCGEEDCKRCGDRDMNQPCIGKTECSVCQSSNGVFCRACLKIRYGEEMEEVRKKKDWMCPHCIEEKGINPYWICNSSLCMRKRKMVPTGVAIYQAREEGYESVAHLIMDKLKRKAGCL